LSTEDKFNREGPEPASGLQKLTFALNKRIRWWVWFGITFILGGLNHAIELVTPDYLYDYRGDVIYPLLVFKGGFWLLIGIISSVLLGVLTSPSKKSKRLSIIAFMMLSCGLPIYTCGSNPLGGTSFSHIVSINYGEHQYQLGFDIGTERGWDYNVAAYIVYRCDSLGIVCDRISRPCFYSGVGTFPEPLPNAQFMIDPSDNRLYTELNGYKRLVPSGAIDQCFKRREDR
jgi:hypothetical protein